jgi:YegS/Rv2252/BmrU family lipid kinase
MGEATYQRIHVVINPASGKDESVLNVLNDTFREHGVDWDVSVTHKYGDATAQARAALADGVDLVAGYGGDGTQHEIANAVLLTQAETGRTTPMGILPGGTGNGFAREMGVPGTLPEAVTVLCTSTNTRSIDVGRLVSVAQAQVEDRYFIQRLYIGVEPEEQTSRELKDKYGVLAYAASVAKQATASGSQFVADVDGERLEFEASKVYVVNSGMMGTGLKITQTYSIEDGLLDCFAIDVHRIDSVTAAAARFLPVPALNHKNYIRQARAVTLDVEPHQPVWTDGEYIGRTPVKIEALPSALTIVVP